LTQPRYSQERTPAQEKERELAACVLPRPASSTCLVVFADDWNRHPSSCQHLLRELLPSHPTVWVNTIGMRRPTLSRGDLQKLGGRLRQWTRLASIPPTPPNLTVMTPRMWPGFRRPWERALNQRLLTRAVNRVLRTEAHADATRRVAITTVPIAAPLVGHLDVDAWIYYCVDDFSAWPGLDLDAMEDLERELTRRVDAVVAVSSALQRRLADLGCQSTLLPHGVDVAHWGWLDGTIATRSPAALPAWWHTLRRPVFLFWGLIDRRLDINWVRALGDACSGVGGSLVLVGPTQAPDAALPSLANVVMPGAAPYECLPILAHRADVLVMPYADIPATRVMEPLKFKEYLATGKPVVVRRLPALQEWADAADMVETAAEFVHAVTDRVTQGVPQGQLQARRRLASDSWRHRAAQLEAALLRLPRAGAP
jgi:hypothetical protein